MKGIRYALLGVFLFAAIAIGARQGTGSVSKVNDPKPQHFVSGIYIGSEAKDPLSDTRNKQGHHLCGFLSYDFPAVTTSQLALEMICHDSFPLTISGCGFGDRISLGVDQAKVSRLIDFEVNQSTATTFIVTACGNGITDGGSFDQADSGYTICCDG